MIRQRTEYIGPVKDGKVVRRAAVTYSYVDLIPVMKAVRDLKLQDRKETTTEITRKQKDILEAFSMKPEAVPNFLKI